MILTIYTIGLLCVAVAMLTKRWWLLIVAAGCAYYANIAQIIQEGPPCLK